MVSLCIFAGDITPGYAYCRHLISFFTAAKYWLLENNDAMVILPTDSSAAGYALSNPDGSEVLVYLSQAQSFGLRLPGGGSTAWTAEWFDPRTGQREALGNVTSATQEFVPPNIYNAAGDAALRLVTVP